MKPNPRALWLPFGFSVALSVISLVTYVATGGSGAWTPAFLAFTPMTLYLAVTYQIKAQVYVETLEARIHELEASSAAVPSTALGQSTDLSNRSPGSDASDTAVPLLQRR